MMQVPEPAKRSPWALRLAIAGGVMLLLGAILIQSQASTISTVMDPREEHHGAYTGAGTYQTETLNDTCYRFYQNADDAVMSVELYRVEGSAMVGEALGEKTCMLDWQPMTADGADLVERAAWTLNESDEYAMVVTCEEDCSETTGWFVSVDDMPIALMQSTSLVLGGAMCCLGVLTTPIALIVYYASKAKPKSSSDDGGRRWAPRPHHGPQSRPSDPVQSTRSVRAHSTVGRPAFRGHR